MEEINKNILDFEDVRIIIKMDGKNYSITPKDASKKDECRLSRIALMAIILEDHAIVTPSLEEIRDSKTCPMCLRTEHCNGAAGYPEGCFHPDYNKSI